MKNLKGFIFDFNRTLYDPEKNELIDGCLEVLEKLSNLKYKMCLVSKKTNFNRRYQISQLGLDKYFTEIVVADGEKNENNFQRCAYLMGLKPEQVAVVGDKIKGDINLGNKLGMKTFWFKVGKFSNELPEEKSEQPDKIIFKLSKIISLI